MPDESSHHMKIRTKLRTWLGWRTYRSPAQAQHEDAAVLRNLRRRGAPAILALLRDDPDAHCGRTPNTAWCRYHVMMAALDHALRREVARRNGGL